MVKFIVYGLTRDEIHEVIDSMQESGISNGIVEVVGLLPKNVFTVEFQNLEYLQSLIHCNAETILPEEYPAYFSTSIENITEKDFIVGLISVN